MAFPYQIFNTRSATDPAAYTQDGVAVSSTNTYYSEMWSGEDADGQGLMLFWTGTPTGTLTMWATDKDNPILTSDADWVQDTTWTPTNPAGSASKFRTDSGNFKAFRKRVKYVNASGSGVLFGRVTVPKTR